MASIKNLINTFIPNEMIHKEILDNEPMTVSHSEFNGNPELGSQYSKTVPILFTSKEYCCGCGACYNICPTKAISMQTDREGFAYPEIDAEKCIRCKMCMNVCSFGKRTVK